MSAANSRSGLRTACASCTLDTASGGSWTRHASLADEGSGTDCDPYGRVRWPRCASGRMPARAVEDVTVRPGHDGGDQLLGENAVGALSSSSHGCPFLIPGVRRNPCSNSPSPSPWALSPRLTRGMGPPRGDININLPFSVLSSIPRGPPRVLGIPALPSPLFATPISLLPFFVL
ncbi:hypothetical protein BC628DRAFT_387179 [Trametes gibbosa]|nr:hypothetical protein BC628DRAFT_387179 [Trametes gibbosa]